MPLVHRQPRRSPHGSASVRPSCAFDAIELELAFTLAKWTGLGLISAYGFLAARVARAGAGRAFAHATILGAIGGALIALKALVH